MTDNEKIWQLMHQVIDPEVPALSITDLGIVRDVQSSADEVQITITPTYSGCPAMDVIRVSIRMILLENGYRNLHILNQLSPAWTTDWMSEEGKQKLKAYGVAPPAIQQQVCHPQPFHEQEAVQCPRCNSYHTRLVSRFGSTACKALYVCEKCHEPFDYFKCH